MNTQQNRPIKKTIFAFVLEGETEKWYLELFLQHENDRYGIHMKTFVENKTTWCKQYEQVCNITRSKQYSKVFWVVDLDVIIKESKQAINKKEEHKPINKFIQYITELKNQFKDKIIIIVNHPCLEIWYFLHFDMPTQADHFATYKQLECSLKKYKPLVHYKKTGRYYHRQDGDMYSRLQPMLDTAIQNARNLGAFNSEQPDRNISEMYLLFDALDKVKTNIIA